MCKEVRRSVREVIIVVAAGETERNTSLSPGDEGGRPEGRAFEQNLRLGDDFSTQQVGGGLDATYLRFLAPDKWIMRNPDMTAYFTS